MTDRFVDTLTPGEAECIIESLRYGVPPDGHILPFTVGRKSELSELRGTLDGLTSSTSGRFLEASYGSGKSHLLKVIRDMALGSGHAVSFITMDAYGGVRGNRMDQILEAVCRGIEVRGRNTRGLATLLRVAIEQGVNVDEVVRSKYWLRVNNSNCDYVANRFQQGNYFKYRSDRPYFYRQCWDALTDLDKLAKASRLRGLVLLVDEFEDVVTNLIRYDYQDAALENLVGFFDRTIFDGLAYFAVTPEFIQRWQWRPAGAKLCKKRSYALTPPGKADVKRLARTIRTVHARAYELEPSEILGDAELDHEVDKLLGISSQDRIRHTIEGIVRALDDAAE